MTSVRRARRFALAFFAAYTLAVIYPFAVALRGPEPFIFGLPFAMIWATGWIVAAFFVLLRLDRAYGAAERAHDEAHDLPPGPEVQ